MNPPDEQPKRSINWAQVLLIVAAAILLIIVGLQPYLNRQREHARRMTCLNNLKSLGFAFRLYAGDNEDNYPTDPNWTTLGSFGLLTNNYMTAYKSWMCPSDTSIRKGSSITPFTRDNVSYAYNAFGLKESVASDTPLMADRTSGDIRSTTPWANNRWTHKTAGGNVLYADGHVEFRKTLPVPMYNGKNP